MDEILQYISEQQKPLVPQTTVLNKILVDLGFTHEEKLSSALIGLGVGYLSFEFGFWPLLLGFETGIFICRLFNRKERALNQLQSLDKKIEMVRKKCEWYFSHHMDADDNEKFIACFYILAPMIAEMKEKLALFLKKFGDGEKELCFLTIKYNVDMEMEENKHQETNNEKFVGRREDENEQIEIDEE